MIERSGRYSPVSTGAVRTISCAWWIAMAGGLPRGGCLMMWRVWLSCSVS